MSLASTIRDLQHDPIKLGKALWPQYKFYKQQRDILYSVWNNKETIVPAGHMLGKDFVTGFCCVAFFITRNPCRIFTTSVDGRQLEAVLWGEIRRFIQDCRFPLESHRGGPLVVNHLNIRKMVNGKLDPLSYLKGGVSAKGEGLSGHHIAQTGDGIPRTLMVIDEASGSDQEVFTKYPEWAHRALIIGNPYECNSYFMWSVEGNPDGDDKGGDIPRTGEGEDGYRRKIIHIDAECSPNVILAREQIRRGIKPTGQIILEGVLPYAEYLDREAMWDEPKKCVGLRARFYKGTENLMYPPLWLNASENRARFLKETNVPRVAKTIGIDSGEGVSNTSWVVSDELGVIDRISQKTPNTAVIPTMTIDIGKLHKVPSQNWLFDRGGGGLQHANTLRAMGYKPRTIGFGEGVTKDPKRKKRLRERKKETEERSAYANKRALMYGILMEMMNPNSNPFPFAIPPWFPELRRQLALFPLLRDGEGKLYLPPKHKKNRKDKKPTLIDIIGHSPDEADALVLSVYGIRNPIQGGVTPDGKKSKRGVGVAF